MPLLRTIQEDRWKMADLNFNETFLNESDIGQASQLNLTKTIQTTLEEIEIDANFAWLIFSLLIAMVWFTYITHYSSRVIGQILTRLLNHFVIGSGYLRIGSLTWDALAGKIMFRDIVYTTQDFSIRVQDGWLVFRWWRSYVPKDISEDMSHSDTRLSVLLNGLEIHIYNRSHLYNELERLFGLESLIIPDDDSDNFANSPGNKMTSKGSTSSKSAEDADSSGWGSKILGRSWRDLIPVIKVEICCGRAVFGNRLVPTTLCLSMEEGHMVYSTKPAMSKLDHFVHVVTCRAENFKVTLAPSLKYTGMNDEPPRLMGEGFVVLSSNNIDFYYYMDEPGIVPEEPVMIELANGDVVECHPPVWGLDIRCGKGTDFSYGPWADRKREQLFKFFYPSDYQPMKVSSPPRPGEKRAVQSFDIRFSTLAEATVDILFSKCKETNAVHMTIGAGSYLEITIPWTVKPDGYTTKISGQLLHVDASTSLQYRSLLEAETLKFSVLMQYPIVWNSHQSWNVSMTGTKATLHLIYEHRYFFQDLINDWSSRHPADLLYHVPYTWFLKFCLKEFELVTVANQYNWVDCSSQHQENAYAAFSGDYLELDFALPFIDFLPPTMELKFRIQGESLDMNVQLPEMSTSRPVLLALNAHARTANRSVEPGGNESPVDCDKLRWRNFVKRSEGWVQCWTVPVLSLGIQYTYHPMTPPGPAPQANVPTPEREELLLTPVRFPAPTSSSLRVPSRSPQQSTLEFDVTTLAPDQVNVELELGPSELFVYGTVLRTFLHLKENIFGEDQRMADMDPSAALLDLTGKNESLNRSIDPIPDSIIPSEEPALDVRIGRPFHVNVSVTMHDIKAHLMKHCNKDDPPCPTVFLEKLSFEMHKTFLETRLQLLLSPAILYSTDVVLRPLESRHLQQGFLVLSALQVRGHAMFSPCGRAIDEETIEYAWLIEATLGQLAGRMTLPQLQNVIAGLEVFLRLALDEENQMTRPPKSQTVCHHGSLQTNCAFSVPPASHSLLDDKPITLGALCPSSEEIKYRMTRLSIDLIDFTLVETGTAVGIQIYPVRLATCNLHSRQSHAGVSILVPKVHLRQYLGTTRGPTLDSSYTALNAADRCKSEAVKMSSSNSTWNRTQASGYSRSSVEELYMGPDKAPHPHSPVGSHRIEVESATLGINAFPFQEWLEVGVVEIGPLYIDVGSSADHCRVDLPTLQGAFLRLHDTRTRRLWFLWDPLGDLIDPAGTADPSGQSGSNNLAKCGCRGGCAFFGRNFNGLNFFDRYDEEPGHSEFYVALANPLLRRGTDPMFAQSILKEDVVLIDFDPSVALNSISPMNTTFTRERPPSDTSNTSTMKNVAGTMAPSEGVLSLDTADATLEEEDEIVEEITKLDVPRSPYDHRSLPELEDQTLQRSGSQRRELGSATSTPSLPLTSPAAKRKMFATRSRTAQNSMSALVDPDIIIPPRIMGRKRSTVSSRASKSESHSELYYSAEEDDELADSSPSEELVSFSPCLPEDMVGVHVVPKIDSDKESVSSSSSSSRSSSSSSSRMTSSRSSRTSNISFNSAVSSADDFSLVDLHLQSARPVVDSPLLLTSYITHLGEADCHSWLQPAPKFPTDIRNPGSARLRFTLVKSGFSSFRLVEKPLNTPGHHGVGFGFFAPQGSESADKSGQPWTWDANDDDRSPFLGGSKCDETRSDATTVLVKVGRPIHVMCCPLSLESAQRFVESLVPTLEHLHPMTFMTRLYGRCIGHVESLNPLKKQRMTLLEKKEVRPAVYRDSTVWQLRGSIQIPRTNICLLQAGIVEQVISLSMLDNPRDLVCVSSVAVCIDALSLHFSQNLRECRFVQAVSRPVEQRQSGGNKSFFASVQKPKPRPGKLTGAAEVVFVEWTQTESEQLMASGTLGKIHLQLRRLNNDNPSQTTPAVPPDNVSATVIPSGCSRVLFNYTSEHDHFPAQIPTMTDEERFGSVMFECGLQGLSLRAVKRVSSVPNINNSSSNNVANDPIGSVVTTVEMETVPLGTEPSIPEEPQGPLGSVPSHSSHMSSKQRSEKETPTPTEPPESHQQQNASGTRPSPVEKDLSSCSLQIQAVWLSFAAPPRTTPAKKSEMALLDRNLLSTASPAINAWMNSGDRLAITLTQLIRVAETRSLSVLAGLMAEALDVQQIHLPVKSKYNCLSLMARTLQEDPSCQLNLVLHRYVLMLRNEWATLEARLAPSVVPPLSTLKQGVVVLGRQWKNAIYTPFMLTYSLRKNATQKTPANANIAGANLIAAGRDAARLRLMSTRSGFQSPDTIDEEERLLTGQNEVESSWVSSDESSLVLSPADLNESTLPLLGRTSASQPSSPRRMSALRRKLISSRHASGFSGSYELKTISASSVEEENEEDDATVPLQKAEKKESKEDFDLYSWLARQQRSSVKVDPTRTSDFQGQQQPLQHPQQQQQQQQTENQQLPQQQFNLLVDTKAIFVSLFASVGLENKRTLSDVLSLSGSASVLGGVEELRVEIFESEWSQTSSSRRSKANKAGNNGGRAKNPPGVPKFNVYIPPEVPAFLCERMAIEIQVNQVADGGVLGTGGACCGEGAGNYSGQGAPEGGEAQQSSSSAAAAGGFLGQIGLWKPQRTTALNFSVSVGYLAQQVNMPLLRLLHQLSSVYGNAKATQVQLREQRPLKRGPNPLRALTVIFDSPEPTPSPPLPQRPVPSGPEPSPSIVSESIQFGNRSFRPPSFLANRLRSSTRFAKGYDAEDSLLVPSPSARDASKTGTQGDVVDPSPTTAVANPAIVALPSCWRNIYHLLDLYASMTAASTVNKQHSFNEQTTVGSANHTGDVEMGTARPPLERGTSTAVSRTERTRIVVFGIMKINRVRLLAMLSGLRLESEIVSLHTSLTYKEKVRISGQTNRPSQTQHFPRMECSLTGHLGRAMIVLLEGVAPSQQTVVKITVGKSQALYSRLSHHGKDKNSGLLSVGAVHVDIPQHPGVLHGMMTRGSKQLSSTLQEFRVPRMASRNTGRNTSTIPDDFENIGPVGLAGGGSGIFGGANNGHGPMLQSPPKETPPVATEHRSNASGGKAVERETTTHLLQPLVMQFSVVLQRLSVTAALLPSLQAQYQMEQVVSSGVTGSKAKFDIDLPRHSLSFTTKLQITENLPPSASIELPQVHVGAEYLQDSVKTEEFVDGVVLCRGNYLSAVAEIGVFEHSLTTDLLNHLVFVQKVFMAEVNDVLNKVSGGDKPVPLWEEQPAEHQDSNASAMRMLLYHLIVRLKGIQITATTPTNTAVRLETGLVELQLSNRVQNVFSQSNGRSAPTFSPPSASSSARSSQPAKLFGRAKVDLNLSLGQLIRNPLFEEAEAEFQQVAFFKTRISLRNAFQDELTPNETGGVDAAADKEVVLITLTRPLIYLQPVAVDKAILVWLNYKNAYDYWAEQRGGWIKDATLVADKLDKLGQLTSQLGVGAPSLGTLFLQLTVDDMGICMPLNTAPNTWMSGGGGRSESGRTGHSSEPEICSAVVVTLENSSISACSSGSLVSKGKFTGLCLRFADDFETSLDDWKPDMDDPAIMNLCVVSEGTYEVCSRTVTPPQHHHGENAKWILHVGWQMEGVDTHFDTSIGRQFSALGHTLTGLTGSEEEEEEDFVGVYDGASDSAEQDGVSSQSGTGQGDDVGDGSMKCASSDDEDNVADSLDISDSVELRRRRGRTERAVTISETVMTIPRSSRHRSKLIEKEMSEQARIIQDLKLLGASSATVEQEMRRLQELEALASKDFRRVMLQRLKRQSVKASSILGDHASNSTSLASMGSSQYSRPSSLHHTQSQRAPQHQHYHHQRSKSVVVPPVVLDLETPGHGSTDDVLMRDAQRYLLPAIEGSPPMSSLTTPTGDAHRGHGSRRPRTPTTSLAQLNAPISSDHERDRSGATSSAENPSGAGAANKNSSEPSVDLELDFKVFINSGKCVLHTRDVRNDEVARRMKKERSFSSTGLDGTSNQHVPSPAPARKPGRPDMRHNASTSRLRVLTNNTAQMAVDLTIFHIPGLDVKVYYESKTVHDEPLHTPASTSTSSPASSAANRGKLSTKKGSLFAWMTLHSIPEETIISPHILEFLEQALEPIPMAATESKPTPTSAAENSGLFSFDTTTSTVAPGGSTTASFPVDVVVYCHVQPSTFRFSCLPVSRVECLLRLPSLHLVFSSKRSENQALTGGGLSVTGCLSDFSLYIFHPYGGGKKTGANSASSRREASDESERKDSLSVNVEFVKFNLSRSRKVNFSARTAGDASASMREPRNGRDSANDPVKAVVRFSTLIDIGSASFKYDMRRLPEILAFPKAWYRRAIVRHLFLGDLSKADSSAPDVLQPASRDLWAELQPDQSGLSPTSAWETLVVFGVNFTKLNVHMNMGNVMGNVSWLTKDFKAEGRLSIGSTGHKNMHIGIGLEGSGLDAKGGIVGGTIELSGIHTTLSIREDPGTEPDHRLSVKLQVLECRLDYMGTSVLMGRVSVLAVDLRDEWRIGNLIKSPDKVPARRTSIASSPTKRPAMIFIHGDLGWDQLQLMISKSTTADLIKMYLKLDEFFQQQFRSSRRIFSTLSATGGGGHSIRRKNAAAKGAAAAKAAAVNAEAATAAPTIEAQHHRHWQSVLRRVAGLEIATLPTPLPMTGTILGGTMELHGGHISLACFHGVNFKSKSWALFSLKDPCVSFATEAQEIPGDADPKDIHVVQNLSFSLGLTGPGAHTPVGIGYRVIEQQQQQNSPASMATVCRFSRTQLFPPQFKTLQDWFLYAFANSRLDAMERFPSLERERERSSSGAQHTVKTPEYHHTTEIIFAFPSLQLHLKSEHLQSGALPSLLEEKPSVDCSFITDFEDHIFVTVDAEAFFFLHDLISSYVREKERVILASVASNQRTQSPELQKSAMNGAAGNVSVSESNSSNQNPGSPAVGNPLATLQAATDEDKKRRILEQIDWRNYECKTWHLEPTVRLLSWAGKRIEPYGVEYILNKLGFSQARTTIPKWVQRGAMDPLDKILSLVLSRTIAAQRAKESQAANNSSSADRVSAATGSSSGAGGGGPATAITTPLAKR